MTFAQNKRRLAIGLNSGLSRPPLGFYESLNRQKICAELILQVGILVELGTYD